MVEPVDSKVYPVYADSSVEATSEDFEQFKVEYPRVAGYLQNPEGFYDAIKGDIALTQELGGLFAKLGRYDVQVESMGKSELAKLLGELGRATPDSTLIEKLVIRDIRAILIGLMREQ